MKTKQKKYIFFFEKIINRDAINKNNIDKILKILEKIK